MDMTAPLPSGRYEIHNAEFKGFAAHLDELASPSDVTGRSLGLSAQGRDDARDGARCDWHIRSLDSGGYEIKNATIGWDFFAVCEHRPKPKETVKCRTNGPIEWTIERVVTGQNVFTISSGDERRLYWCLPEKANGPGTPLCLSPSATDTRCHWTFEPAGELANCVRSLERNGGVLIEAINSVPRLISTSAQLEFVISKRAISRLQHLSVHDDDNNTREEATQALYAVLQRCCEVLSISVRDRRPIPAQHHIVELFLRFLDQAPTAVPSTSGHPSALQALASLLSSTDSRIQARAAEALSRLTIHDNIRTIVHHQETIRVIHRLTTRNPLARPWAMTILDHFSTMKSVTLVVGPDVEPDDDELLELLAALKVEDEDVADQAAQTLYDLTYGRPLRLSDVSSQAITALVQALSLQDPSPAVYAAMTLSNIMMDESNRIAAFKAGAVLPLVRLIARLHRDKLIQSTSVVTRTLRIMTCYRPALKVAFQEGAVWRLQCFLADAPADCRHDALCAIINLSAETTATARTAFIIPDLVQLLRTDDDTLLSDATFGLRSITMHDDSRGIALADGAVPLLCKHLNHPNPEIHIHAIVALRNICKYEPAQAVAMEHEAIPRLIALMDATTNSSKCRIKAATALREVIRHEPAKEEAIGQGIVKSLIRLLRHSDVSLQVQGAAGLRTVCMDDRAQKEAYKGGAIPLLVEMVRREEEPDLFSDAVAALNNITRTLEVAQSELTNRPAMDALVKAMKTGSVLTKARAARAIWNVAGTVRGQEAAIDAKAIPALLDLTDNEETILSAMGALCHVSIHYSSRLSFDNPTQTRLLQHPNLEIRSLAVDLLHNILTHEENSRLAGGATVGILIQMLDRGECVFVICAIMVLLSGAKGGDYAESTGILAALQRAVHRLSPGEPARATASEALTLVSPSSPSWKFSIWG